MGYLVKEIYQTIQGEGFHTGRAAVFLRFAGCNLWSGREEDRATAACKICDTDFAGGTRFASASELAECVDELWPGDRGWTLDGSFRLYEPGKIVVCTGGEPLVQLDRDEIKALHRKGFAVAVETNGTIKPPRGIDWLTCSPKDGGECVAKRGDELKLLYPQQWWTPQVCAAWKFKNYYLQPIDGPNRDANTAAAVEYCRVNTQWRLSLQTHKYINIP